MDRLDFLLEEQNKEEKVIYNHNKNFKYISDKARFGEIEDIEAIDIYNNFYNENISAEDVEEKEVKIRGRGRARNKTKKIKDYYEFVQCKISEKISFSKNKIKDLENERLEILREG